MKSKRTFDRKYDLTEEVPGGLYAPYDSEFVQLFSSTSRESLLTRIHIRYGAILCGATRTGRTPWRVLNLSADREYTFCLKCQRAAKAIKEGGA